MSDVSGAIDQLQLFSAMTAYQGGTWDHFYASVGEAAHPASTEKLMTYWTEGKGGTEKIRWPEPCAFCRCVTHLRKYFPKNPEGLCNHLEMRATGHAPNPEHSRTKHCPC